MVAHLVAHAVVLRLRHLELVSGFSPLRLTPVNLHPKVSFLLHPGDNGTMLMCCKRLPTGYEFCKTKDF